MNKKLQQKYELIKRNTTKYNWIKRNTVKNTNK